MADNKKDRQSDDIKLKIHRLKAACIIIGLILVVSSINLVRLVTRQPDESSSNSSTESPLEGQKKLAREIDADKLSFYIGDTAYSYPTSVASLEDDGWKVHGMTKKEKKALKSGNFTGMIGLRLRKEDASVVGGYRELEAVAATENAESDISKFIVYGLMDVKESGFYVENCGYGYIDYEKAVDQTEMRESMESAMYYCREHEYFYGEEAEAAKKDIESVVTSGGALSGPKLEQVDDDTVLKYGCIAYRINQDSFDIDGYHSDDSESGKYGLNGYSLYLVTEVDQYEKVLRHKIMCASYELLGDGQYDSY